MRKEGKVIADIGLRNYGASESLSIPEESWVDMWMDVWMWICQYMISVRWKVPRYLGVSEFEYLESYLSSCLASSLCGWSMYEVNRHILILDIC